MALTAPPQTGNRVSTPEDISDALDEDIAKVRAEIDSLTRRQKLLTSSLISSTVIQEHLSANGTVSPAVEFATQQYSLNIHRLGIGVISFPFDDPSPEIQSRNPLLGIQIDICDRTGRLDSPYYLFCIRAGGGEGPVISQELRIHRHTIPAFVPLQEYEKRYLPPADEGYGSEDSVLSSGGASPKQDLHGLINKIRHDLVAWRSRQDAIGSIREQLAMPTKKAPENSNEQRPEEGSGHHGGSVPDVETPVGKFGVREFEATGVDARQVRILWSDDRLGRIKISDQGGIDKAAVFGSQGRIRNMERILTQGDATVFNLLDRLQEIDHSTRVNPSNGRTRGSRSRA
ncbi:Cenp-O kinetochore centromere component-domain-containing protein [Exophiala viscosa]|uniref:Cenp-O kinetochore centromere component-domain-containing protein n=1 Tax=Exophiala viscosa TaxID=2486360 RepID=A0AAN6E340_9EURO|nr:Cenp-O kinetochore centromere component-domain-containing protein [Exophiala viscosa]